MEVKTGLYIGVAFASGLLIGGLAGYAISKKNSDIHTQQAIDEMKDAHKKEIESLKKGVKNEEHVEEKREEDPAKKPPIMEMASVVNSSSDNNNERTKYSSTVVKEQIRNVLEKAKEKAEEEHKEKPQVVVNYDTYVQLTNQGYLEKTFCYDVLYENWRDWDSDNLYEPEELPFDTSVVEWDDDDICYICDKDNHSIYILEKV